MKQIFGEYVQGRGAIGLLILRLVFGLALVFHGMGKMGHPMDWMGPGAPVPGFLQFLSFLAEFGGGLALISGLLVPLASLGIVFNMLVAISMVHLKAGDPFVNPKGHSYESAAGYLAVGLLMLFTGPGALSVDAMLFGKKDR